MSVKKMTPVERYMAAVRCESVDRTPYDTPDALLIGKYADESYTPGDQYLRPEWAMDKIIEGAIKYGGDTMPNYNYYAGIFMKDASGITYLTPGKDIDKNLGPMAEESNPMTAEHYDFIIKNGMQAWVDAVVAPTWTKEYDEEEARAFELMEIFAQKCTDAGLQGIDLTGVPFTYGATTFLSVARGYNQYLRDMRKHSEALLQVSKIVNDWEIENAKMIFGNGSWPAFFKTSLGRCDTETVRMTNFEKFVWEPTFDYINEMLMETDTIWILHMDGNYDEASHLLEHLRPKKTIVQLDGFTHHERVADAFVKHQICMEGDIPAAMLTMGTPEEVYDYCMQLKRFYGPGLILNAGCCHPANTKIENLDAVREAAYNMNY